MAQVPKRQHRLVKKPRIRPQRPPAAPRCQFISLKGCVYDRVAHRIIPNSLTHRLEQPTKTPHHSEKTRTLARS